MFGLLLLWVFGSVHHISFVITPVCAPELPQVSTYVRVVVLQAAGTASSFTPAVLGVRKRYVFEILL